MKLLIALVATLLAAEVAAEDRYRFSATIQDIRLRTPSPFDPPGGTSVLWGESPSRGKYEVGQTLNGIIQYNPDLLSIENGSIENRVYLSSNSIEYKTDDGFVYSNAWDPVIRTETRMSLSEDQATKSLVITSSGGFFLRASELSVISFVLKNSDDFNSLSLPDKLDVSQLSSATLTYRWDGDWRSSNYNFLANITSVSLVPEPPVWFLFLAGAIVLIPRLKKLRIPSSKAF